MDGSAQIEVGDNGQGIAPELLPHIFERFLQGDSSSTRRHGGLGLGLAIVKNLAEMHGGSVRRRVPVSGRGATFTVVLPLSDPTPERAPEPVESPPRSKPLLANVVVMVVDDEADARDLVQRLLEDAGARVSACETAQAALQTIEDGLVPDVIVSDVAMPEQDGYDFMKRVRQMKAPMSSIPAAALTALARVADRTACAARGFSDASHQARRSHRAGRDRGEPGRPHRQVVRLSCAGSPFPVMGTGVAVSCPEWREEAIT